ncbi:hypothetical protein SPRA44_430021 [Serratia proteamaculans]|nr:hypothetical protein SPRA44_430021 [Serratia proteamaculans]
MPALAQARYLAVLEDRQLLTDKCAVMNNRTANFFLICSALAKILCRISICRSLFEMLFHFYLMSQS